LLIGAAQAGGFYTAPANPVFNFGPEAVWMNPAGMAWLPSDSASVAGGLVLPVSEFEVSAAGAGGDDGGNAGVAGGGPTFYAVKGISDRVKLGVSILSPYGVPVGGTGVDFGRNFAGRYGATEARLSSWAASPAASFKVTDQLSLGAGVSFQHASFYQTIAINTPGADGQAEIDDIDDQTVQYYGGAQFKLSPATLIGVVYRSEADLDLTGNVNFSNLPVNVPTANISLAWTNPQSLQVGVQQALSPSWILSLDVLWEDWSVFSRNRLEASFTGGRARVLSLDRQWKDTWAGGLALTHIDGPTIYNAGLAYSSSPVDDSDRTIDLPLDENLALSFSVSRNQSESFSYTVGANVLFSGDASVDQTAQGVRFAGEFDTNVAFIIGGGLTWRF
jgi:long-chain fatty acid transport protein